jgi:hypothetical protein
MKRFLETNVMNWCIERDFCKSVNRTLMKFEESKPLSLKLWIIR